MHELSEKQMLRLLSRSKRVLLVEPRETRYIPLGLAKIATFVKESGGRAEFGVPRGKSYDLVAVTTLFTYDSEMYKETVRRIRSATDAPILIGGPCASLAPRLLDDGLPGEQCLFQGYSPVLDQRVPDYSIDWGDRKGWGGRSYTFTTRGCVNRCPYCAVPKIEKAADGKPGIWTVPNWRDHIVADRPCVLLDNNITASGDHLAEVVDFMVGRGGVIWENGIDCKHVGPERARLLGRVKWGQNGLRTSSDRIGEDGVFQRAIRLLLDAGINHRKIMPYVLFNFNDTPAEAEYRLMECVRLGVQPYPQRYVPLDQPSRRPIHVGRHWTKRLGMAFQHFGIMGKFRVKGTWKKFVSFSGYARRKEVQERFGLEADDLAALKA